MANSFLVKNYLVRDFLVLADSLTLEQALDQLGQQQVNYAMVDSAITGLPVIITTAMLQQVQDQQRTLAKLVITIPHVVPVQPETDLAPVVKAMATQLRRKPDLAGFVVWNEQENPIGIVPRKTLAKIADHVVTRGGDTTRLEGLAATPPLLFYCPQDQQEKLISYYDPDNPPKCSQGHRMTRKPLSP